MAELHSNGNYWMARWRDSHGKQRGKSLGSKAKLSKREAKRLCKAMAVEHELQPGRRDQRQAPTLEAWTERYMELRTDIGESTRAEYDTTIGYLLDYLEPGTAIDKLTREDAAVFRAKLVGQGLDESTIRKHIRACKVIFRHAVDLDKCVINPFDRQVGAPVEIDNDWRYVKLEELDELLTACPDDGWRHLLALCRLAGLRRGEATRVKWGDIDWQARRLTVQHKGRQTTKKRRRQVPIQPRLYEILLAGFNAADDGEQLVCGAGRRDFGRTANAIVKRAGLETWSKPFHTLRKNCESDWLARYPVMDVCRWLGHDPAVAAKHYHQTTSATHDDVTGVAAEAEADRIEQLEAELARQRARTRRVIKAAREARRT